MSETDYRNRHDRLEQHWGVLPSTLVELSSAIDVMPSGTTLEAALTAIDERIIALEARGAYLASFTIDAEIT